MLAKIRSWFSEARRWHNDNVRTWADHGEPGPDGLSPFQREAEDQVREKLASRGVELTERQILGEGERYITATIPRLDATIWIYHDGTEIQSSDDELRLERWDTRTPDEHRARVFEFLDALLLRSNKR